ncbi:hypothetical protein GCG54_00001932 [Colletotrichum gloeosporioides]|uniref:Uncharacterized protein n=1 Tax=Colletotrichum gloeosporioides TaxID=474922 RepID=A0A8H4CWV7_COLGL|nr:uncharacterized protein GCG54_00001932 [Colletotrichum gloeosporioides]KAF3811603.1 hypothetical protein GCG54_00001932 [Colletotrichum gloeosporioides]
MRRQSERPRGRNLKTYSKKPQSRRSLGAAIYRNLTAGNYSRVSSGDESSIQGNPPIVGHRTPSASDEQSLPETEESVAPTPEETNHDRVQRTKDPYHIQTSSISLEEASSQDDDDSSSRKSQQSQSKSSQKSSITSVGQGGTDSAIKTEARDSPEALPDAMLWSHVPQLHIETEGSPFQGRKRKRAGSPFGSDLMTHQPQRFNQQEAWKDPESSNRRSLPVVFGPRTPSPAKTQTRRKVAEIHPQDYKVLPSASPAIPTLQRGVRDGFERREVPKFSKHYFDGKRRRRPPPTPGLGSLLSAEKSREAAIRKEEPGIRKTVSDPANAYLMSGAILDEPREASRTELVASSSNRNANVRPSLERLASHVSHLGNPHDVGKLENDGAVSQNNGMEMKRSYGQGSSWMATTDNFVLRETGPTTRRSSKTTSEPHLYLDERDTRPPLRDALNTSGELNLSHLTTRAEPFEYLRTQDIR